MEIELVDSAPAPEPAPSPEPNNAEAPSSDGNATIPDGEAPVEEPKAPEGESAPAPEPEAQLYELPDGRKVDAETLQREWSENFMPEFTRRSQRLAEIERGPQNQPLNSPQQELPKWKDPNYVPETYAEIIEIAEQRALERVREEANKEVQRQAELASMVDQQIAAIRAKDPKLDENALFQHANKYGFTDLSAAYENFSEMKRVALATEERVTKNLKTRAADPVAGAGIPPSQGGGALDYGGIGQYSGAQEFLARIKS